MSAGHHRGAKLLSPLIAVAVLLAPIAKADDPDTGHKSHRSTKSDQEIVKESATLAEKNGAPLPETDIVKDTSNGEPTPDEIRRIKSMWEEMRRAQETPVGPQPKPSISLINLNLSPGSTPPVVRVSSRTGVIMDFIDASGAPWYVDRVINMSENEIEVEGKPADKTVEQNSVFAKAKHFGSIGNVAIFLKKLPMPVIVTMLSGQKETDYRVDFRVPAYVNGDQPISREDPSFFDNRLASATMGINPDGCLRFKTDSKQVMACGCKDDMILRVDGTLLSPAPIDGKKVTSIDGSKAYIIPPSPVVSVAVDGHINLVNVEIKE